MFIHILRELRFIRNNYGFHIISEPVLISHIKKKIYLLCLCRLPAQSRTNHPGFRDRQDRLYQRILALIFLVIGIFLITIGLYITNNDRFTAGCLMLGFLLLIADIFIYMELLKNFYKKPLDEDLIEKYNRLIYKSDSDKNQKS